MIDFLRNIFDPLFDLLGATLTTFHGWGAPWWLSIMMLTIIVRSLLFPLTARQVKSMRKMQELKPEMDEIRARNKDDSKKQQEELMKLYGERRVSPLGGCLPLLVQLPIFITLYATIRQFDHLESFRTGGLAWFANLTIPDPYFILPLVYVGVMMASQEVTLRRGAVDPRQKQLMRFLPVVFGFFLIRFPAALLVYSITTTSLTLLQNLIIYRNAPKPAERKDAEAPAEPETPVPAENPTTLSKDKEYAGATARSGAGNTNNPSSNRRRRKKKKKK